MPKKRQGSPYYWYDFTVAGNRFRGSTETNDLSTAKIIEAKLRHDILLGVHVKKRPRLTLDAALGRYWQEHGQYARTADGAIFFHSAHLLAHFGTAILVDELDDAAIAGYKASQIGKMIGEGDKARVTANATINRRLTFLRAVLNRAKVWGVEVSEANIKKHLLREPEARTRWITPEEADKLIAKAKPHLKPAIRFALLTGARLSNIVGLKWEDVNLKRRFLRLTRVKSRLPGGRVLEIPISDALLKLLTELGPQKSGHVFLRRFTKAKRDPEPILKFRRSFKQACKDAKIKDFRFHDLRHTAASWMVQNGTPLDVVQEILGHSTIGMTQKYAHRQTKEKLAALQGLAQIRHNPEKSKTA